MDEWALIPALAGAETIDPAWLWAPHNEHRLPLPRLILLGLLRLAAGDFRAGMVANVLLLGGLSLALILAARRVRGRSAWSDAFFPLALLHWGHVENLLWGWQVGFVLATTLASLSLVLLVRQGPSPSPGSLSALGACLVGLPLCGAHGLLLAAPLSLWLLGSGLALGFTSRPRQGGKALLALAFSLGALAVGGLYLIGLPRPGTSPDLDPARVLRVGLQFLSASLGLVGSRQWPFAAGLVGGLLLGAAILLASAIRSRPDQRLAGGLLAYLAAFLVLALGIGFGRGGAAGDPAPGLASRYTALSVPGLCAVYLAFLIFGRSAPARAVPLLLLLASALVLPRNLAQGLAQARDLKQSTDAFERDILAGRPPVFLADRYSRFPSAVYPHAYKSLFPSLLEMARSAGLGFFAHLVEDPDYRIVRLPADLSRPDPMRFVLEPPRFVYAVRLHYLYVPQAPLATFTFTWKGPGAGGEREGIDRVLLFQDPEPDSVVFWIDAPLSDFRVQPDDKPSFCHILAVELLVPLSGEDPDQEGLAARVRTVSRAGQRSSSGMLRGGKRRITRPAVRFTSTPRSTARSGIEAARSASRSAQPSSSPRPRTSSTRSGRWAAKARSRSRILAPRPAARSRSFSSSIAPSTALAAAQASGFPP
jgi:hypothetical protein